MTTTLYTGYLAVRTGTTTFVEQTGTGYARVAINLDWAGNRVTNRAVATFTASGADWGTGVTQFAIFSAITAGSQKFWWAISTPRKVANTKSYVVKATGLMLYFNDIIARLGATSTWVSGNVIGQDNGGNPIKASNPITVASQVLVAQPQASATYAATGALPTADPHVMGQLWANATVVTVSAG
jgi:hypothetical protein